MISVRSVRFKLTLWYLVVLAGGMILFGVGTWFMLRHALLDSRSRELDRRLGALEMFLVRETHGDDLPALREEAREYSTGLPDGQGLRLWDTNGRLIYEKTGAAGPALRRSKTLSFRGQAMQIELSLPSENFYQTLSTLERVMLVLFPLVLAGALAGGWWLAQRALRPVGAMTREARSINSNDFAARLSVPATRDELQELAEAWNELLGRIEASVHTITRFTADAAHELSTPVAVIRTSAELALRHTRNPKSYRQTLESIQHETEEMTELLDRLLLLARGDAQQWQFQFDTVFADDLLRGLTAVITSLAESKQIALDLSITSQPAMIWADESAIRRLVMILADNALKYTPSGGRIAIGMSTSETSCILEVTDTGCGIPAEDLEHVFERFYRADRARTGGTGVGLGLAIARTIVEAHHGTIQASSAASGGSVFRVVLPSYLPSSQLLSSSK